MASRSDKPPRPSKPAKPEKPGKPTKPPAPDESTPAGPTEGLGFWSVLIGFGTFFGGVFGRKNPKQEDDDSSTYDEKIGPEQSYPGEPIPPVLKSKTKPRKEK
jgi:hypothetical protein